MSLFFTFTNGIIILKFKAMNLKTRMILEIDKLGGRECMVDALEKCKKVAPRNEQFDFDMSIIFINALYRGHLNNLEKDTYNILSNLKIRKKRYLKIYNKVKCKRLLGYIAIMDYNINYVEDLRFLALTS